MTRKTTVTAVLGALLAGLALTGCADSTHTIIKTVEVPGPTVIVKVPGPTVTVKVPGPTKIVKVPGPTKIVKVPDTATPNQVFLKLVRQKYPVLINISDTSITARGRTICAWFDEGRTFSSIMSTLRNTNTYATDPWSIIGLSIGAYCPEHNDAIR